MDGRGRFGSRLGILKIVLVQAIIRRRWRIRRRCSCCHQHLSPSTLSPGSCCSQLGASSTNNKDILMKISYQSMNPNGQPACPLKGSAMDACQQRFQMGLPLHGVSSLKACPLSSLKKASVTIAGRESRQGRPSYAVSDVGTDPDARIDIFDGSTSSICNLSHSLVNEHEVGHVENCNMPVCGLEFQSVTPSFMHATIMEDEMFSVTPDASKEGDQNSSKPSEVLVISVSSAVKLDDRQLNLISRKMQRLTGFRKLRLENIVDPSLIAGFVIDYCDDGSHVIDLSVKGQLAMLAARLESSDQKSAITVGDFLTA
ncbi:ATP synthase F1, delta subunit family protein [Musa troglodytarum]|uniref:ATP synthase F1, delta subunit family protein n=1 Tax=Musa troglodytarum TaxID=320322 RepID=A0A9E7HWF2_9LILI|nr:ATP synthase F1, delta subunit family protein [Musa troglodytarum]